MLSCEARFADGLVRCERDALGVGGLRAEHGGEVVLAVVVEASYMLRCANAMLRYAFSCYVLLC